MTAAVFLLIQQMDLLHLTGLSVYAVNRLQIRRIADKQTLAGILVIHLILFLIDRDDIVSCYGAFILEQERPLDAVVIKAENKRAFLVETVLRCFLSQGSVRRLVIFLYIPGHHSQRWWSHPFLRPTRLP